MKLKTYLLVILSILALGSQSAKAQETQDKKAHEIYLYGNLKELNLTGVAFKSEIKPNRFVRFGATNLDYTHQINNPDDPQNSKNLFFSGGIQLGLENRVKLTEKLFAFYGVDLVTSLTYQKNELLSPENNSIIRSNTFMPGFSFGSGFIFNIIRNLSVSLELEPSIFMSFTSNESDYLSITTKSKTSAYIFDFNSDDVKLALIYRW
jgi:hypothetical protein